MLYVSTNSRLTFFGASLAAIALLSACGADGADGSSCTTTTQDNGDVVITCDDGTTSTISAPTDGEDCAATDNGDGTYTIECPNSEPFVVDGGEDQHCETTDNGDGTYTIACPDSDPVTLGGDTTCTAADNGDGTYTVDCPGSDPITFGEDSRCTISDNGDGTRDLTCGDDTITIDPELCGNGVVDPDEECDEGAETATCSATCQTMYEYVVAGNHYDNIQAVDLTSGQWTTYTSPAYGSNAGATVLDDGTLLVADYVFSGIHRFDPTTGQRSDFITGLGNPDDVVQISTGDIFVADVSRVLQFDRTGTQQRSIDVTPTWSDPKLAVGPNDEVYLFAAECVDPSTPCDSSKPPVGEIIEIDPATGNTTTITRGNLLEGVGGIAVDDAGVIYAASASDFGSGGPVVQIDPATGDQTEWRPATSYAFNDLDFNWAGELIGVTDLGGDVYNLTTSTEIATGCPSPCSLRGMTYFRTATPLP